MKIALVGPGFMEIPPKNWGAVESLIWDYSEHLKKKNISVDIINNTNLHSVAEQLNNIDYDFIHVQYDDYADPLSKLVKKPFCVTNHYGYIKEQFPDYHGWKHVFNGALKSQGIIALSPEIKNIFKNFGYNKFLKVLRNGARTKDFRFSKFPLRDGLCLGKVEPRKRQSDLANICSNKCNIDFVGPIIDPTFRENNTCHYAGIWDKASLYSELTNYRCLVLLSNGEAAPLVVPEALSAGLSLVLSRTAAANLDISLPFVHILDNGLDENTPEIIQKAIDENKKYRTKIRKYALSYFDWDVICEEYIQIIKDFISENSLSNNCNQ